MHVVMTFSTFHITTHELITTDTDKGRGLVRVSIMGRMLPNALSLYLWSIKSAKGYLLCSYTFVIIKAH